MHCVKIRWNQKAQRHTWVPVFLKSWDSPAYNMRPSHHVGKKGGEERGTGDAVKLYMRIKDEQSTQQQKTWNNPLQGNREANIGFLTISVVRSKVDFNAKRLVGIFDGGQGEVGQGLLGKVRHHSLWKPDKITFRTVSSSHLKLSLCTQLCRLTVNFQLGKGFHFSLFVRRSADVCPRILVGDPRNSQHVDSLEALRGKFAFQLDTDQKWAKRWLSLSRWSRNILNMDKWSLLNSTCMRVTLDHLISGAGYPEATQGMTASDPTVTSLVSGREEIWGRAVQTGKRFN